MFLKLLQNKSMRSIIEILQTEKKTLRSEQNFLGRKQLVEHECKRSAKLVRGRSVRLVRTSRQAKFEFSEQNFLGRKQLIEHECKRSANILDKGFKLMLGTLFFDIAKRQGRLPGTEWSETEKLQVYINRLICLFTLNKRENN